MIRFQCESCGRLKAEGEAWILGFAAENIGAVTARREISIASSWDRPRAVGVLAVHFCSDECRVDYTNALFGEHAGSREVAVVKRRVKRVVPGAVVDTVVAAKKRPKTVRKTIVRRRLS